MAGGGLYMSKHGQATHDTISQFMAGNLNRRETAELLQVRERTIQGVVHGNRDRSPRNKKQERLRVSVMDLVEKKYFDFNMSHCLERLKANEAIEIKYATFRW